MPVRNQPSRARIHSAYYIQPRRPKRHHRIVPMLVLLALVMGVGFMHSEQHTKAIEPIKNAQAIAATTAKLTSSWQSIVADTHGSVDIAVYDHATGKTTEYSNVGGTFNTASIVKLSILESALVQDQANGISLTANQLADAQPMIENSDNDAATALWNLDGGTSALNGLFKQLGASSTTAGTDDYWGLTQTTARDQLKVVNAVAYPGRLLTTHSALAADTLLDNVESDQRWGVSGGVPTGVNVELKNGWLQGSDSANSDTWDVNSIGHVHGNGVDYTIAVLTANDTTEQDGINTIQALSAATWQTLTN